VSTKFRYSYEVHPKSTGSKCFDRSSPHLPANLAGTDIGTARRRFRPYLLVLLTLSFLWNLRVSRLLSIESEWLIVGGSS